MPKTVWTPRDELVCGKLDKLDDELRILELADLRDMVCDIRHDCERMEAKLIARKDEVAKLKRMIEEARLQPPLLAYCT